MVDARLLLPAAGAWVGAALCLVLLQGSAEATERHRWAGWAIGLLLLVASLSAVLLWWCRGSRWAGASAAALCGFVLGGIAASAQVVALTADPVGGWIDERASVSMIGLIGDEPRTFLNTGATPWEGTHRTTVRFATASVAKRDEHVAVHVPMMLQVPSGVVIPEPGTWVRVEGRLRPGNPLRHVAAQVAIGEDIVVLDSPGIVDRAATAMRDALRASVAFLPADVGSLIAGLSVGDESQSPPQLTEAMLGSGLSHLTAVSGGNVAIVVVVVLGLAGLLRLPMPARIGIALAALTFFVILVRPQPSVLRASVMAGVVLVGMLSGGRRAGPSILATSVLALMIVSPFLAVAWGFALSVAATAGLILIAPWVRRWIDGWVVTSHWPLPVRNGLAITGAAQLATLPLLVAMGGAVGWIALPANLLAMPAVVPVTIFGLLAAMTGPIFAPLALVWAGLAAPGAWWISRIASMSVELPGAQFPWPPGWVAALALLAVFGVAWWGRRHLRVAVPVVIVVWIVWTIAPPDRRAWPPPDWIIVSCAVGQGDAHVVRVADDAAVLIDVGPDPAAIDTCLTDLGISTVPAIVISHFHADHVHGLSGAIAGRAVGSILATPLREPPEQFAAVDEWRGDIPLEFIRFGEVRRIGDVTWRAVWPRRVVDAGSRPNNTSAVLLIEVGGYRALFTGDVEPAAQSALLAELPVHGVDIVKVPHHGSRFQLPDLPSRSHARIAIVSAGAENRYGHPAAETLAAWRNVGALIGRTDTDGDVAIVGGERLGLVSRAR